MTATAFKIYCTPALQEATGGGESDESTDVGKLFVVLLGPLAGPTTMFEEIYCTTFAYRGLNPF